MADDFKVGDRVIYNDREYGIPRGSVGTVEHVNGSILVVLFDDETVRRRSLKNYRFLADRSNPW